MSLRLITELWFLCLILLCPILIYGVLRWERATTRTYIAAVAAHDTKQLDTLFWMHRFGPGTRKVINRWTTDFGGFPQQAACNSTRPVEMPGAARMLDLRLWLLSPAVPIIRHRLEVQIGDDAKVTDARYDTHDWYFTPTSAGGGSFTNQGLRFRFFIPMPVLVCLAIISWLLALACRALGKYVRRQMIPECRIVGVFFLLLAAEHGFADDKTTAEGSAPPASIRQELGLAPLSQLGSNWLARFPLELSTGPNGEQSTGAKEKALAPISKAELEALLNNAAGGDRAAQYEAGRRYSEGQSVEKDPAQAFPWLKKAGAQGHPLAQKHVGAMYLAGLGTPMDLKQAQEWLLKAAAQGETDAELALGFLYFTGLGGVPNADKGLEWMTKAAEQGNPGAQTILGVLYLSGQGVALDPQQARKWFEKAAAQGEPQAMYNLGVIFTNGQGVAPDKQEAFRWFHRGADAGWAKAQLAVATFYRVGNGVARDIPQAIAWYTKAAQQKNPEAQYSLGGAYATGTGVEKDLDKAREFFRLAAEAGHAPAQNDLGMLLIAESPANRDLKAVHAWVRRSAAQGYAVAEYNLGLFYHEGIGVPKDVVEALKWIYLSANQGYKKALPRRAEILALIDPPQQAEARRRADAFVAIAELHLDFPPPLEK